MELFDPKLLERITVDPQIEGGKPVIKGTRLTVDFICFCFACRATIAELLREHEGLTREDLLACLWYAREIGGGKTQPYCFDLGHQWDDDYTLLTRACKLSPQERLKRYECARQLIQERRKKTTGETEPPSSQTIRCPSR